MFLVPFSKDSSYNLKANTPSSWTELLMMTLAGPYNFLGNVTRVVCHCLLLSRLLSFCGIPIQNVLGPKLLSFWTWTSQSSHLWLVGYAPTIWCRLLATKDIDFLQDDLSTRSQVFWVFQWPPSHPSILLLATSFFFFSPFIFMSIIDFSRQLDPKYD